MSSKIHVGTSGWSYAHWKDNFYPLDLKSKDWLHYYSTFFSTVEINSTFYHLPRKTTIQNWVKQVPENFVFSVKASGYITHRKRLIDGEESLKYFYQAIKEMKSKMGPILFQLPPSFKINEDRLGEFISFLDDDYKYAFEFRHPSWFVDDVYERLAKNKIALCITDLHGTLSPLEITSDFTYIRLHGPQNTYRGYYGKAKLRVWQKRIESWPKGASVYCYFDNDEKAYAVKDANLLKSLIKS